MLPYIQLFLDFGQDFRLGPFVTGALNVAANSILAS
jgi:hypothetical protein